MIEKPVIDIGTLMNVSFTKYGPRVAYECIGDSPGNFVSVRHV
jgi:hypothetical protein